MPALNLSEEEQAAAVAHRMLGHELHAFPLFEGLAWIPPDFVDRIQPGGWTQTFEVLDFWRTNGRGQHLYWVTPR